ANHSLNARALSPHFHADYSNSIGYCWFLYHTGRFWRRLPRSVPGSQPGTRLLVLSLDLTSGIAIALWNAVAGRTGYWPLTTAPSAADSTRPWHTPLSPDA